jgi:hypothetical protein
LDDDKNKYKSEKNVVEVNVDDLIQEKRSRSKGVRFERGKTPVKDSNYNRMRNVSLKSRGSLEKEKDEEIFNLEEYIDLMNSNISLKNINRPFKINFHMIILRNDLINNHDIFYETPKCLNLEIEVQMYCGMDSVTQCHKLYWKGISNNPAALIKKILIFDIKYSNLPLMSSLIVKIKIPVKASNDAKNEEKKLGKKTVAWTNFRLFDHLKKLKSGK